MGGARAVIATDQPRAFGHPEGKRVGEIAGAGSVIETALVKLGFSGARINREKLVLFNLELGEEVDAGLRTGGAVKADDIGAGRAEDFHRLGKSFAGDEPALFADGERGDDRDVAEILKDLEREQQLVQGREGLEENQVTAAVEQRADLLAKDGLAVLDGKLTIGGSERKRADRSADEDVRLALDGLAGDLGGAPVDFADLMIESEAGKPDAVRAEAVRLDHLRAGVGVFAVNAFEQLGLADVDLFKAMAQRHAEFVKIGAGCAIANDDALI